MSASVVPRTYMSLAELARRLHMSPGRVEIMLSESVEQGVLELVADGYRLSESADRLVGDALRALEGES